MSTIIQVLLAVVMTASGLLVSPTARAESSFFGMPSLVPAMVAQIDLGMPKVAPETTSPLAAQQIIPDSLLQLDDQTPAGSLSWAGIDEFAQLDAAPMAERKDVKRLATQSNPADEIDEELLTAAPAPEPPTSVLAGIAAIAGGVWTRARRKGN